MRGMENGRDPKSSRVMSCLRVLLTVAFALVLQAQTPAPQASPPPAPAKPIRHLEYAFSVDYLTNGEGHNSGMSVGGEGGNGSGVGSLLGGGGRRGTIDVDVQGFTPDGALIIGVNEMLQSAPRPAERFTCTIYGDGHVMCPGADGPLSDAENLLLSMLGRGFVEQNVSDANSHWQRSYQGKDVTVVTDYTITDPTDTRVTIVKHATIKSYVRTIGNSVEDGKIVYDRQLSIPESVHDTVNETRGYGTLLTTFDMTLVSDSFAKP